MKIEVLIILRTLKSVFPKNIEENTVMVGKNVYNYKKLEVKKLFDSLANFYMISFIVMFCIIIGLSLIIVIRQWWKNRHSPLIVTQATVIDKRIEEHYIRSKRSAGIGYRTRKLLIYYITFNLEGGEHIEMRTNESVYSELQNGDYGKLTFKGSKYMGFVGEK